MVANYFIANDSDLSFSWSVCVFVTKTRCPGLRYVIFRFVHNIQGGKTMRWLLGWSQLNVRSIYWGGSPRSSWTTTPWHYFLIKIKLQHELQVSCICSLYIKFAIVILLFISIRSYTIGNQTPRIFNIMKFVVFQSVTLEVPTQF